MALQALLAEVEPGWYANGADVPDPELVDRARGSALGRRLLAGWLATGAASALLAPSPDRGRCAGLVERWPRARLEALVGDIGVLAYAPAIRAEVRREPVRRLKAMLGNSYLLALDRTVWDGRLEPALVARLSIEFGEALAVAGPGEDALRALFSRQGRHELQAWARRRDPALADWSVLVEPREAPRTAFLPEKPVLRVYTHHEMRAVAA